MEQHKKLIKVNNYKCDFCEKTFKLNFGLNRHVEQYHSQNKSNRNKSSCIEYKTDCILNLKLCKLNGVWKSKPNLIYRCNVCFEKFHSENNLTEHVKIHDQDKGQTQCEVCLKIIFVSELNDHMQQIHNKNSFTCLKCNLRFDKKQNLKRHFHRCTKRSLNKFQSKHKKNPVKTLFVCTVCGTGFTSSFRLKFHIISDCEYRNCKYSGKTFSRKNLWSKHLYEYNKYKKCVNMNNTYVNKVNQNMLENNCRLDIENSSVFTNVPGRSSSDNVDSVNSHQSIIVQTISINNSLLDNNNFSTEVTEDCNVYTNVSNNHNTSVSMVGMNSKESTGQIIVHNTTENDINGLSIKRNNSFPSTSLQERMVLDEVHAAYNNESVLGMLLPHGSTKNNCNVIVKIEQNECDMNFFAEGNNSDNVDERDRESSEQGVSHTSVINNSQTIKVEKIMFSNDAERNISNHAVNDRESPIVPPLLSVVNIKQEPKDLVNNSTASSNSHHLPVKEFSNIENVKKSIVNELGKIVFTCKVCNNSTNDRHTFALHMSCHSEGNFHECIVCDKKFPSVSLWQNHLMFHREKQHLILMSGCNEAHSNKTTDLESTEHRVRSNTIVGSGINQVISRMKHEYNSTSADVVTSSDDEETEKPRKQFSCSICKIMFPSMLSLVVHQAVHKSSKFSCRFCNRTFSAKGPCTNHEKSHNPNKNIRLLVDTKNNSFLKQKKMEYIVPESNDNVQLVQRVNKKKKENPLRKQFSCSICKKKFAKRCYLTNHMKLLHKIDPYWLEQQANSSNVNGEENGTIKSPKEHETRPSVAAVHSFTNDAVVDKLSYCTLCMKQFKHMGALASHMHVHSANKQYECRYCSRKFNMKGPLTIHERTRKCIIDTQQSSYGENFSTNDGLIQRNNNDDSELDVGVHNQNINATNLVKKERFWLVCDVCDKKFSIPDRLIVHRKLYHRCDTPFLCKVCNKSYDLRCHWNRHLKWHYSKNKQKGKSVSHRQTGNAEPNKLKCEYCKKEYVSMSYFKKHLSLNKECRRHCKTNFVGWDKSKSRMQRQCKICHKTYSTAYNRKVHVMTVHKQFDNLYSDDSEVEGMNDSEVEGMDDNEFEDVNYTIAEDMVETVLEDGDDATIAGNVNNTVVENMNNTILKYVDIQKSDSYKMVLKPVQQKRTVVKRRRRHQIAEDKKRCQCNICGNNYSNRANLSRHHRHSHKLDQDVYQQLVTVENKTVPTSSNSNITDISVINVISMNKDYIKKYSCVMCKMVFSDDNALQKHKMIHTANHYKCNDCGQQFETNITLGEHILQNHNVGVTLNVNNDNSRSILNESSCQSSV